MHITSYRLRFYRTYEGLKLGKRDISYGGTGVFIVPMRD
ncbi:hypothetical protein B4113_2028 [Geobacillus sp. B4113_201601]|nr:hypothetical protein B4113_2028 [Geobacillus sp. B4113_201601]